LYADKAYQRQQAATRLLDKQQQQQQRQQQQRTPCSVAVSSAALAKPHMEQYSNAVAIQLAVKPLL
jgi:hypothetical protein